MAWNAGSEFVLSARKSWRSVSSMSARVCSSDSGQSASVKAVWLLKLRFFGMVNPSE
jgi:hypothetical protein